MAWPGRHSLKTCHFGLQPLKVAVVVAVGAFVVGDVAVVVAHTAGNAGAEDFPSNWEQGKMNWIQPSGRLLD